MNTDTAEELIHAMTSSTRQAARTLIRPYVPNDWDRLCFIHDSARLDELRRSVGEAAFLSLEQTAQNEGLFSGHVAVAELDGVVTGFVAFTDDELTWLYVDPGFYRHGVGLALVLHAVERTAGRLRVEVLEGNEPALKLYTSAGFSVVDRTEGRLQGNEQFRAVGLILQGPIGHSRCELLRAPADT